MKALHSITRAMRRILLALVCALALGACTTWRERPTPAPATLREFTGPVHVIRHGTYSLVLRDACVKGDTLYGYSDRTRMAVALRDVRAIRRKRIEPIRSVAAGVVGAAVTWATLVFYTLSAANT
ncbi:MAG TPA: hypothetical protein VFS20_19630 [Longimicrobium sp.]|nr:hypothetical protein [Longimicrobium sp.]